MSKITLVGGPADGRTFTPSSEQRYKGKLIYLNATKPNQQEQVYSRTSLSDDFWIHQGSVDDVAEKQQYEARKHYETQAEIAARLKAELEAKQKAEVEAREKAQVKPQNKYDREIIGKYGSGKCIVDVYRVLAAFGDIPPEIQHAIKKLLAGGKRGHKNEGLDYLEAIHSIEAYLNRLDDSSDQ